MKQLLLFALIYKAMKNLGIEVNSCEYDDTTESVHVWTAESPYDVIDFKIFNYPGHPYDGKLMIRLHRNSTVVQRNKIDLRYPVYCRANAGNIKGILADIFPKTYFTE